VVSILIEMRASALRNARHTRFGLVSLIGAGLLGLLAAASTLLLGFTATGNPVAITDQVDLLALSWAAGRIGFAAFSGGDPAISLDLFRLLPIPRRAVARSLVLVGFLDVSMIFLTLAFASVAVAGFRFGPLAGIVGTLGVLGLLALVSILSTIVAAVVPSGSRRRADLGTLLAAGIISAVVVLGTLVGPLLAGLATGRDPGLGLVLRVLPSGWAGDSVAAAADGDAIVAVLPLLGLAIAILLLLALWPLVLGARLVSQATSGTHGPAHRTRRILPATPIGAVVSRELRLWIRDPNRAGFLLIALVVGLGICIVPLLSEQTAVLLPFAGIGTAIIAAAIAGNSYGFDGASVAIVLNVADAQRVDVRGRQLAWLLLIGPYSIALSVVGLLVAHQASVTPWVLALLGAVLGVASGIIPVLSLVLPQPLDDNGSPGPAWVAKAYATIIAVALSAVPALACLIVGAATSSTWLGWLAVPVGIGTGVIGFALLGRVATTRFVRRGPELYEVLAKAGSRN
jgi:ABC-2 type transport system permease protein